MCGAGRDFKTGFSGAFRKRGGWHRADADRVRRTDRDGADRVPTHRAEKPTSHAKKYDILRDVSRGIETHGHVPRHAKPDYNAMQDLGHSVGKSIRERFLAPASASNDLSRLGQRDLETRFGLKPGALNGATVEIEEIPGSRFVSVKIDYSRRD